MASILFVSKPVVPPWNDSGKNLVRDLAAHLHRHRATVMTRADSPLHIAGVENARVYGASAGGFSPALRDQASVFAHLLTARGHAAWHYFFAPNPRSCSAGRALRRLRRLPVVHTVSSAPRDPRSVVPLLFADLHVVLSRHTEAALLAAGLAPQRIVRIAPAIEPLAPFDAAARDAARTRFDFARDVPLVVYPGDLEFGGGAELTLDAMCEPGLSEVQLGLACRAKTPRAREAERALRERVRARGLDRRVRFIGETPDIHALLACADVVALPATDLYAKMDYPLVLLEAMSLARPVVVARDTPAAELCADDAVLATAAQADALAEQLRRQLCDEQLRHQQGMRARAALLAHYAADGMARRYEDAYDRLLG